MSTGHFEDTDHDRPGGIAEAMRDTAFSFEAPASAVLHAAALAHARRHRRRSAVAGTLAAVAAVGVASAVVTQIPTRAGDSSPASTGTTAGSPAAPDSRTGAGHTTPSAAKPATEADRKALAKFVLDSALGALPAGTRPVNAVSGVAGSKFPAEKHLAVTPPTDLLGGVNSAWSMTTDGATSVSVAVEIRIQPATCEAVLRLRPHDSCTVIPFAKGGEIIADQSRKDPIHQTGAYFLDYVWQRPDGAQVTVSQVGPSVAQFPWTSDRVTALLALPAWDQAVARLKALLADAGSTSGS